MALTLRNQIRDKKGLTASGFALPTILIASIVMLTVLLVSVTSTTALRVAINTQYYAQLAQLAGEAGTAYAEACLHSNANTPSWSDAKPLTPATDCSGNVQNGYPSYVLTNATNIRTGFSIGMPAVDSFGHATTVPNTGFTEITRESNGDVWRRYNQPAVQSAVVPDQCSGTATSALGWNTPYVTTTAMPFPEASAQMISISNAYSNVGPNYFRKDFTVTSPATYNVYNEADDQSDLYIDGQLLSSVSYGTYDTKQIALGVGCHTIVAKLTNGNIRPNPSGLKAAVIKAGSSVPTVVTDTSWRVVAGVSRHFSEVNYYADASAWTSVRDAGPASGASGWTAASGDTGARIIYSPVGYDGSNNYPSSSYTLFRDNRTITVSSPTQVKITDTCDDSCTIYMDGNVVAYGALSVSSTTLTLSEGTHKFGIVLYNTSGASGIMFTANRTTDNAILTSSDSTWSAANFWTGLGSDTNNYSYDNTYFPIPDPRTINTLIVAGGGSGGGSTGGGGGGGGVVSTLTDVNVGSYPVVVGGGATAPGNQNPGINGSNSSFNGLVAIGGGGGAASRGGATAYSAGSGGSGGGSQDYYGISTAGLGTNLQGNPGGSLGYSSLNSVGNAGGGGGAGGSGWGTESGLGGNGGIGVISSISGTSTYYGGGGGGGGGGTGGLGGGGNGADVGAAGTANTGGGGGGGWGYSTGNGGAGGSGVVIISYPTGSVTATGGTMTTSGGYTIHTFTSSGTFVVTATNY